MQIVNSGVIISAAKWSIRSMGPPSYPPLTFSSKPWIGKTAIQILDKQFETGAAIFVKHWGRVDRYRRSGGCEHSSGIQGQSPKWDSGSKAQKRISVFLHIKITIKTTEMIKFSNLSSKF